MSHYLKIGEAIEAIKHGKKVSRDTWYHSPYIVKAMGMENTIMFHLDGKASPWAPSHEDILAENYLVINE